MSADGSSLPVIDLGAILNNLRPPNGARENEDDTANVMANREPDAVESGHGLRASLSAPQASNETANRSEKRSIGDQHHTEADSAAGLAKTSRGKKSRKRPAHPFLASLDQYAPTVNQPPEEFELKPSHPYLALLKAKRSNLTRNDTRGALPFSSNPRWAQLNERLNATSASLNDTGAITQDAIGAPDSSSNDTTLKERITTAATAASFNDTGAIEGGIEAPDSSSNNTALKERITTAATTASLNDTGAIEGAIEAPDPLQMLTIIEPTKNDYCFGTGTYDFCWGNLALKSIALSVALPFLVGKTSVLNENHYITSQVVDLWIARGGRFLRRGDGVWIEMFNVDDILTRFRPILVNRWKPLWEKMYACSDSIQNSTACSPAEPTSAPRDLVDAPACTDAERVIIPLAKNTKRAKEPNHEPISSFPAAAAQKGSARGPVVPLDTDFLLNYGTSSHPGNRALESIAWNVTPSFVSGVDLTSSIICPRELAETVVRQWNAKGGRFFEVGPRGTYVQTTDNNYIVWFIQHLITTKWKSVAKTPLNNKQTPDKHQLASKRISGQQSEKEFFFGIGSDNSRYPGNEKFRLLARSIMIPILCRQSQVTDEDGHVAQKAVHQWIGEGGSFLRYDPGSHTWYPVPENSNTVAVIHWQIANVWKSAWKKELIHYQDGITTARLENDSASVA